MALKPKPSTVNTAIEMAHALVFPLSDFTRGSPHFGQAFAWSLICVLHSLHLTRAMALSTLVLCDRFSDANARAASRRLGDGLPRSSTATVTLQCHTCKGPLRSRRAA